MSDLFSGVLGALIGAFVAFRISSVSRRSSAIDEMIAAVYPLGFKSHWEPNSAAPALIFHEAYPDLWKARASLRRTLSRFKQRKFDGAWQKFMAIEYYEQIPSDEWSKIFFKGTYASKDEAIRRSAEFLKYLEELR